MHMYEYEFDTLYESSNKVENQFAISLSVHLQLFLINFKYGFIWLYEHICFSIRLFIFQTIFRKYKTSEFKFHNYVEYIIVFNFIIKSQLYR